MTLSKVLFSPLIDGFSLLHGALGHGTLHFVGAHSLADSYSCRAVTGYDGISTFHRFLHRRTQTWTTHSIGASSLAFSLSCDWLEPKKSQLHRRRVQVTTTEQQGVQRRRWQLWTARNWRAKHYASVDVITSEARKHPVNTTSSAGFLLHKNERELPSDDKRSS